jgi:1,4-dihydroxy-2-naphthoyl-CoA hydrolase
LKKKIILQKINKFQKNTMTENIGIQITDFGDDSIEGKMPVNNKTKQPFGLLHGGASAAFAETLGSIGANIIIDSDNFSAVGIELNVSHLKSITNGWVFGRATAVRIGKKIQVWQITIEDNNQNKVCVGRLTLAILRKK